MLYQQVLAPSCQRLQREDYNPVHTIWALTQILQSRGLDCGLANEGKQILHDFSYYTLSAYWYPFRRLLEANQTRETQWQYRASKFLQGAKLSDAAEIAMFDRK